MPQLCIDFDDGQGFHCVDRPGPGEGCGMSSQAGYASCAPGATCTERLLCETRPEPGHPCLTPKEQDLTFSPACSAAGYCGDTGMCRALPGDGEPCVSLPQSVVPCAHGFGCFDDVCRPLGGASEPCQPANSDAVQGSCRESLACTCLDASCQRTGVCLQVLPEGAACGGANTVCTQRTECRSGVCVAGDTLAAVENECAP